MNIKEFMDGAHSVMEEYAPRLRELGLFIHTEDFISDASLNETTEKKAKYVSSVLVISTMPDTLDEAAIEHRLGIGASVKGGVCDGNDIFEGTEEFRADIELLLGELTNEGADTAEVVKRFADEAEMQYSIAVEGMKKRIRTMVIIVSIVSLVAIALVVVLGVMRG